jgi:hypothetical protein
MSPLAATKSALEARAASAPDLAGITATQVLAFHGQLSDVRWIRRGFSSRLSPVRAGAWRSLAVLGAGGFPRDAVSQRELAVAFDGALEDPALTVRQSAWAAAVWTRQPWLLTRLRQAVARRPETLSLLAALGDPQDGAHLLQAAGAPSLGDQRFDLMAAWGFPEGAQRLLHTMESERGPSALLAAAAFQRLTGFDAETGLRVQERPRGATANVVPLDVRRVKVDEARRKMASLVSAGWKSGVRYVGGRPEEAWTEAELDGLDRLSLWELRRRQAYRGVWQGRASELGGFL